jgi:hypothetical protein
MFVSSSFWRLTRLPLALLAPKIGYLSMLIHKDGARKFPDGHYVLPELSLAFIRRSSHKTGNETGFM